MSDKFIMVAGLALSLLLAGSISAAATGLGNALWTANEIAGAPVIIERKPTMSFSADGRVSGFSGCNRYTGGYTYDAAAGTLTFTPIAGTRMACPEPQSAVEQAFLSALGKVSAAKIDDGGLLLTLSDTAGEALVRFIPGEE